MSKMFTLLKQLCKLNGGSGDENRIAEFIISNINTERAVVRRDNLGNVLVFKKGKNTPTNRVMFAAHMDEVAFIVTSVTKDGFLRFAPVGGIAPDVVFGRRVVFENGTHGVIAGKPVHLLDTKEKSLQPSVTKDLMIDIGAASADETGFFGGEYCYFDGEYSEFGGAGNNLIRSKALDDRIGCAIMLDMLGSELDYDAVFAFTVQEEVGCRGAAVAAFNIEPDICVVLEATTACDTAGISGAERICEVGAGPVIGFMDKSTAYDRKLYNLAFDTALDCKIKAQTKTMIAGGNDAGAIHKAICGVRTIAVSAPTRYLHTPACVADRNDILQMRELAEKLLCKFAMLKE